MDGCGQGQVHSACALNQAAVSQLWLCSCNLCVPEHELISLSARQDILAWAQSCANVAT